MPAVQTQGIAAYRLFGSLFFGAVKLVENLQDHLPSKTLVLDLSNVIYIDSSGADTLSDLVRACNKAGVQLHVSGLNHQPLDIAQRSGFMGAVGPVQTHDNLQDCWLAVFNQ